MPDGYSQIFRSYVFGPSGFWTMAPLCYAAKFDQILPSGNLVLDYVKATASSAVVIKWVIEDVDEAGDSCRRRR